MDSLREHRTCKLLEMDLPKDIRPLEQIYKIYWELKIFPSFDNFYEIYRNQHQDEIKNFQEKINMDTESFNTGLKARIYRTWASILTQIHLGYQLSDIFGNEKVFMSRELDEKNCDVLLKLDEIQPIRIQVKKATNSKERRIRKKGRKDSIEGIEANFVYKVFKSQDILNPIKRGGKIKVDSTRYHRNKIVDMLPNGFFVFKEKYVREKIARIVSNNLSV